MRVMKIVKLCLSLLLLPLLTSANEVFDAPPTIQKPAIDSGGPHIRGVMFINVNTLLSQEKILSIEPIPEVPEEDYYRHRVDQLGRELHTLAQMKYIPIPETDKRVWSSEERMPDMQISHFTLPHFTSLVAIAFPLRASGDKTKYQLNLSSEESYDLFLSVLKKLNAMFMKGQKPKFEFHIFIDAHQPVKLEASFENTYSGLQINLAAPKGSATSRLVQVSRPGLRKCIGLFAN